MLIKTMKTVDTTVDTKIITTEEYTVRNIEEIGAVDKVVRATVI